MSKQDWRIAQESYSLNPVSQRKNDSEIKVKWWTEPDSDWRPSARQAISRLWGLVEAG